MLEQLLSNKNLELSFKSGSILENVNTSTPETMVADIDELGTSYGTNVANFLSATKHIIIPAMDKVEEILIASIQSKNYAIKNSYNIVKLTMPTLFVNLEEHGGLNMVGNGVLPMVSVTLPTPAKENIRGWFITDSDDINYDVNGLLLSKSDDDLCALWEKYIYSFSADNVLLKDFNLFHYSKLDELILIYAAVRNLTTRDPGEVSNLMTFKNSVINIFDFVKSTIKRYLNLYKVSNEFKLVHNIRITDGIVNIYTFDTAYNKFIEESAYGVDSIIGYSIVSLKNDNVTFSAVISVILEQEEMYYKACLQNIDMLKLKANKEKIEGHLLTYKVHASSIFRDIISQLPNTIEESTFNSIYKELLIKTEEEHDELNVELFVRKLFSAIYPRIKKFLDTMLQIDMNGTESGNALTPSEVVLYATLELITSELMDQVMVKEVAAYKV